MGHFPHLERWEGAHRDGGGNQDRADEKLRRFLWEHPGSNDLSLMNQARSTRRDLLYYVPPEFQSIPHDQVFIIEWNQVKNKGSLCIMLPVL